MKRRRISLALLMVPILGLFLWAQQAASWRPKTITNEEFTAQQTPQFPFVDWQESENLTPAQRAIHLRLLAKNWQPLALAPDEKRMFAQNLKTEDYALLSVGNANTIHLLKPRKNSFSGEWRDAQFSPDGRYLEFSCFESTPPQVFDARTGKWLWSADYWNAKFAFSPDGEFAAHTDANDDAILVRETATGRELKRLPYAYNETRLGFSRDSNFLLAEVAPRQFRRWRLR